MNTDKALSYAFKGGRGRCGNWGTEKLRVLLKFMELGGKALLSSAFSPTWFPQNEVLPGQCFANFNVLKKSSGMMGRSPDFEIPPPELLMQTVWRRAKESALWRHSGKFCWTVSMGHILRTVPQATYYHVRSIFWGWTLAHEENWVRPVEKEGFMNDTDALVR